VRKFEYLILDLVILTSPFIGLVFYPRFIFPDLRRFLIATVFVSLFFVIWDNLVTGKWWRFNYRYLTGFKIFKLPIEEVSFFPIVSFSSLVIWLNLKDVLSLPVLPSFFPYSLAFLFLALVLLSFFKKRIYTFFVFLFELPVILFDLKFGARIFFQASFYLFNLVVIILTFIFNYYLTSRPIVLYEEKYKSGFKVLTIPIEDFIYGLVFLDAIVVIYEFLLFIS
jgi:lycopene cyclase domain-containing protein